jgi:excisionase family DNA binding protein
LKNRTEIRMFGNMPSSLYFTTGQAAQQLGASQAQIRALCESGAVEAETTLGGQYRIPAGELSKLLRDGLPPIPRPLPDETRPAARNGQTRHGNPKLLAEPSSEVVSAVEEVTITERQLEKRKLERALEEENDWFRARADQEAQREAEQLEADRRRQNAADAERRREERDNGWLRYAMDIVPHDARGQVEEEIHDQVQAALEKVRLGEPAVVPQRVVDAIVAKVLKPWRRSQDIARAIEDARQSLPFEMRGYPWEPSTWVSQACQAAAQALEGVRPDAAYSEMRALTREAAKGVIAAFESHQAVVATATAEQRAKGKSEERSKQDRENRERLLRYPWLQFPYDMPDTDREAAIAASRKALAELAEGMPERDLEAARDRAVKPFLDALARRKHKEELITAGLQQILPCIQRLEEEWDFDQTAWTLCREISEPIRKALQEVLIGDESAEEVGKRVRTLVWRQLDV